MLSQNRNLLLTLVSFSVIACLAALWIAAVEQRRQRDWRTSLLEFARHLARLDFGHTFGGPLLNSLPGVAQALDSTTAILRQQWRSMTALLELDRALLGGTGIEPIIATVLPAIAAALRSRSVSIVLLSPAQHDTVPLDTALIGTTPPGRSGAGHARSFDYLVQDSATVTSRGVSIDVDKLREARRAGTELDINRVGVDSEEFLAPLTHCGARAFRLCPLEFDHELAGFLCVGFVIDTHGHDVADFGVGEIAERLSLALALQTRLATAANIAGPLAAMSQTNPADELPAASELRESGLYRALHREEFELVYQPIVDAHSHYIGGVEALIRWPHGVEGSSRLAAEFIPVAEQSGVIVELGDWVVRTACMQFDQWRSDGIELDYVSVNVSSGQLRNPGLLAAILTSLQRSAMAPSQLQLEINQSALNEGPDSLLLLRDLARRGVRIALDDFGAGTVSLSTLQNLPIHALKIDGLCVAGLTGDTAMQQIVAAAINLGAAARRRVIAEGVESVAQRDFLVAAGCDAMQGYLFAPPMTAADLGAYVRAWRCAPADRSNRAA